MLPCRICRRHARDSLTTGSGRSVPALLTPSFHDSCGVQKRSKNMTVCSGKRNLSCSGLRSLNSSPASLDICYTVNKPELNGPGPNVLWRQESLANANVSARQSWYIGRNSLNRPPLRIAQQYQRNLYIVEKYFQCATIPSLTVRVYLYSFSRCCLPNMPISAKFRGNSNLQQFKVIQGR